jgi:hypothetical protein
MPRTASIPWPRSGGGGGTCSIALFLAWACGCLGSFLAWTAHINRCPGCSSQVASGSRLDLRNLKKCCTIVLLDFLQVVYWTRLAGWPSCLLPGGVRVLPGCAGLPCWGHRFLGLSRTGPDAPRLIQASHPRTAGLGWAFGAAQKEWRPLGRPLHCLDLLPSPEPLAVYAQSPYCSPNPNTGLYNMSVFVCSDRQVSSGWNLKALDKLIIIMIYTQHNH